MKIITTTYDIGSHFLPYLINGDCSGLEDEESVELDGFENGIRQYDRPEGYRFGHWDITEETNEFAECEITGLMGNTTKVVAVWTKEKETA